MRTVAAALRPVASTMRFAHLTELSLAPCAARRLWARTRSSSIPLHYHGSQRRLHCRTRLDERFSDLFLLLSDVELGRNGARWKSKYDRSRKAKQVDSAPVDAPVVHRGRRRPGLPTGCILPPAAAELFKELFECDSFFL